MHIFVVFTTIFTYAACLPDMVSDMGKLYTIAISGPFR